MGNCIVLQEKIVKVMKTDGKVLEYNTPIKVEQILSEYAGHAISDKISGVHHLSPDDDLHGGCLYYLLPPLVSSEKLDNSREGVEHGKETCVVRIKIMISKQKLQEMVRKGGLSIDDMVSSELQKKQSAIACRSDVNCKGWKPPLESIPEVN